MWARADYYNSHHQRARGHKTIRSHLKVAYYSFPETQLRALRNSFWSPFFFSRVQYFTRSSRKSWKHLWDLASRNRSWCTINILIMNGRSLEAVSECYRYKIPVKPRQKPQEVVVNIFMFIARAILRYFSARLSCTHAQFCSRRRPQKNRKSTFWPQSTRKLTV